MHVVLVGAAGRAGRRHASFYSQRDDVVVHPVDTVYGPTEGQLERAASEARNRLLDICTPNDNHAAAIIAGYRLGFRDFVIEKPSVLSLSTWCALLEKMPDARFATLHNYAMTSAVRAMTELVAARGLRATTVVSNFDKDRIADSRSGRGIGADGALPHVFRVEMPHQLNLAELFLGRLVVVAAEASPMPLDGQLIPGHGRGMLSLQSASGATAVLTSDLTASVDRVLTLLCAGGHVLRVRFNVEPATIEVTLDRPGRTTELVFSGPNDGTERALAAVLDSAASQGPVPAPLSPFPAARVLEHIDSGLRIVAAA